MIRRIMLFSMAAILLLMIPAAAAQAGSAVPGQSLIDCFAGKGFDEKAAKALGADELGMRKYVIAFLKRGPNLPGDKNKAGELQAAHLKNIGRMASQGKLVLAGPFLDDGELRGIYVFAVETLAEAEALVSTDPAVKAGSLVMELKPWYGSAALMEVNAIHERLARKSITGSDK